MTKMNVSDNCVLVKIFDADKEMKNTSPSGIITANQLKPLSQACGIGEAVSVGSKLRWIKEGDMVLFSWKVEDMDERFMGRDDDGEYRIVKDFAVYGQIYGVVKINKKNNQAHVIPKKFYALAEPFEEDLRMTNSMFQIPVTAVNPQDDIVRKMGIKVGDWIICIPNAAYPIYVKRKPFFFIFLEDIIAINKGEHHIAINRKHVSEQIRLGSREEKIQLN